MATRIYIASDLHAAEKAWRKFINAIRADVYKADVALLAGDLTGKAIVPILERGGGYEAEVLGVHRRARDEQELAQLQRDIADLGYYSFVTSEGEANRLSSDEHAREELLERLMTERVHEWMALATERLVDSRTPLYMIPGNDDEFTIDEALNTPGYGPINGDGKVLDIPGELQLLSSGWSNNTPWATPREETEEQLFERLDALAQQVRDPRRAIFMIHVPPHDSGLDEAPLLDENLRPTISAGDVLRGPVGSTAVRRIIEKYQPVLSVHGHIHESGGERRIGDTLSINPGSEANHGILRGYLIDLTADGVQRSLRVEG